MRTSPASHPSCTPTSSQTAATSSHPANASPRLNQPWPETMTGFANPTHNIACNTLPCSFTRMGLPALVALRLPAGTTAYQPRRLPFWTIGEAAARIARLLDGRPDGATMEAFLPEITGEDPSRTLRCRAAVAATFVAGLELTRNGAATLDQDEPWQSIHMTEAAITVSYDPTTAMPACAFKAALIIGVEPVIGDCLIKVPT